MLFPQSSSSSSSFSSSAVYSLASAKYRGTGRPFRATDDKPKTQGHEPSWPFGPKTGLHIRDFGEVQAAGAFGRKKSRQIAPSNPEKPIILENPVAWVQKLANLCGPTQ
jgi:hypothetical protein